MAIQYIKGDVTKHCFNNSILVHIVNTSGVAASGVVVPIERKWPDSIKRYRQWYKEVDLYDEVLDEIIPFQLGQVQFTKCNNVIVANMLAQHMARTINEVYLRPINLEALKECMLRVAEVAIKLNCEIIGPKFGSLRAGASWENEIEPMINELWSGLKVTIYNYEEK